MQKLKFTLYIILRSNIILKCKDEKIDVFTNDIEVIYKIDINIVRRNRNSVIIYSLQKFNIIFNILLAVGVVKLGMFTAETGFRHCFISLYN